MHASLAVRNEQRLGSTGMARSNPHTQRPVHTAGETRGVPLFLQAKLPLGSQQRCGSLLQRKCACGSSATPLSEECEDCASGRHDALQTKLGIGGTTDIYEQEADRVADQVLAKPADTGVSSAPPRIQRYAGQGAVHEDAAPASVEHVLAGHGRPLEPALRGDMEQRFGRDFSEVRVHSDGAAEQSARDVNAIAYTAGHHIVFGSGQLTAGTHAGRHLIAHELTHVIQQTGAGGDASLGTPRNSLSGKAFVQRSPQAYVEAMNKEPEPDYGEAAKHLNGESPRYIRIILNVNLNGATLTKARLYEAGKTKAGVGPCSNICRMTEKYYLMLHPDEKPYDYGACEKVVTETDSAPEKTPAPVLEETLAPVPEETPEPIPKETTESDRYCPDGPVDDATVQKHIDDALAFALAAKSSSPLEIAFSKLGSLRDANCCDLNLAAAEHYMYARWQVASGDLSMFWILASTGYGFVKLLHLAPKSGDCPITRASVAQIRWASQGAVDGDMDYYSSPQ